MKVKVSLSIGLAGCKREEILDFPDDYTDEEIESDCEHWMSQYIDWNFEILEDNDA